MNKVVAVGALGGSGTRAVAQVLIDAGIYMGDDLNGANDNLVFTRLFKNPAWLETTSRQSFDDRLDVFREYMEEDRLSIRSASVLVKAAASNPAFRNHIRLAGNVLRKLGRAPANRSCWGWKEPNTQIFFDELSSYFDGFRYIHVLRHGLYMAFSANKQQLVNWGKKYEVHLDGTESEAETAYKQLEYWIRSTKKIMSSGQGGQTAFMLLNHSDFCQQPKQQIDRMMEFLEIDLSKERLEELYKIPKDTESNNRFRNMDLGIFDQAQIDFVKSLGFEV